MAVFGDERNWLVYAQYKQWPIFSAVLLPIGLIVGLLFAGLMGALMGIIGGVVMGFIGGLVIGRNKKLFPVLVERWVKYGDNPPKYTGRYPGRVNVRTFKQENAPSVEDVRVEYLEGTMLRRMSNFEPSVWSNEDNVPVLRVLQIGRMSYLPITWSGGRLLAHNTPVYYADEVTAKDGSKFLAPTRFKGKQVGDAIEFEKDELGKFIPDPNGFLYKIREEETVIWDSNKMREMNGQVVDIPTGLAAKMNNERGEFTLAWSIMDQLYRMANWWKDHGGVIVAVICMAGTLIATYWAYSSLNGNYQLTQDNQKKMYDAVIAQNEQLARLNVQVAAAMLKAGWNVSGSFVYGPLVVNGTGQVPTGQNPNDLKIPFIN
jgi:hypothetical protein